MGNKRLVLLVTDEFRRQVKTYAASNGQTATKYMQDAFYKSLELEGMKKLMLKAEELLHDASSLLIAPEALEKRKSELEAWQNECHEFFVHDLFEHANKHRNVEVRHEY